MCVFGCERRANLFTNARDVSEVEAAVWLARRADAYERDVGRFHGFHRIGGRAQFARLHDVVDELVHLRLDDRALAVVDDADFGGIDVDADDVVSGVSKARRGYTANIPDTKDTYPHQTSS